MDSDGRLWLAALRVVQQAKMEFDEQCAEALLGFIRGGVLRMEEEGSLTEAKFVEAEQGIIRFAKAMVDDARSKGMQQIDQSSFYRIRRQLCPIWPFCK